MNNFTNSCTENLSYIVPNGSKKKLTQIKPTKNIFFYFFFVRLDFTKIIILVASDLQPFSKVIVGDILYGDLSFLFVFIIYTL